MDVFIAGAGIAGLAAAIAMTTAGHDVEIAEQAIELREIGAALSLWPNALAALDHLGVGDRVREASVEAPTASVRATSGRHIVDFDNDPLRRALGGLPVIVLRAELQRALLEECAQLGVSVGLGCAVEGVRLDRSRVLVRTSHGESQFDAVIGADGIRSQVRSALGVDDTVRDCDRVAWRAMIPNTDGLVADTWLTVGTGLQLIASPAPGGLIYWAADTPGGDMPSGDDDPKRILRRRFDGWHDPIGRLVDATPGTALVINRIVDRRPPKHLRQGPVVLIGDAAHAMTPDLGQGGCQALEDAALLLACSRSRKDDDPAGLFETFERIRVPRVRRIVRDSHLIGRLATAPQRPVAAARDAMTRLVPESLHHRRLTGYASVEAFERQLRML
ncbi:MAG TPA: FAD-dependent monooxygenase [Acidimicrobiales bacterium]|nr:FAD-dependent monooxygenase [Acidimicrobiales bacterium]